LAALLVLPNIAMPATIVVDGTDSTIADDGVCSLREAINNANDDAPTHDDCASGSGADTLELKGDVVLTELDNNDRGLPLIATDITIEGGGFTVSRDEAAPDFGILKVVLPDGSLTLADTTVSNGATADFGGGVWNNGASLTMTNTTLSGNSAARGGGMCTDEGGSSALLDCSITDNVASRIDDDFSTGVAGGVEVTGYSDTHAASSATIESSTISGNIADTAVGGLLVQNYATSTLTGSTISNNTAFVNGGAIAVTIEAEVAVTNSTLSGNSGGFGSGGGLFVYGAQATVTNSTISGNSAAYGGGAYSAGNGTMTLKNSTVVGNNGTSAYGYGAGGIYANNYVPTGLGYADVENTLVAANTGGFGECGGDLINDLGNNFSGDLSCPGSSAITPGVDIDTALADNGGPSETHTLLDGSVAIDAAGSCGLADDQRGYGRDALCDSGSFEHAGSCKLVLEGAATATVGEAMELDVHCATPNGRVGIAGGSSQGKKSRNVPGCGTVEFDVRPPRRFGIADADNEGDAFSDQTLPPQFAGSTIYYQAIDFETCELTNVIAVAIE
jgi:hypothetical protein